jgi:hypothetical protein
MTNVDTSAEAVERLDAEINLLATRHDSVLNMLRDLLAERDRLRKIVQDLLSVMPVLPVAAKHIVGMEDRYNAAITNAHAALKETGHE